MAVMSCVLGETHFPYYCFPNNTSLINCLYILNLLEKKYIDLVPFKSSG